VNVHTQQPLTALRDLLSYRIHELEAEVHVAALGSTGHRGAVGLPRRDEPIPLRRLMVLPQVERCAPCQAAFEGARRVAA